MTTNQSKGTASERLRELYTDWEKLIYNSDDSMLRWYQKNGDKVIGVAQELDAELQREKHEHELHMSMWGRNRDEMQAAIVERDELVTQVLAGLSSWSTFRKGYQALLAKNKS